jgi:hypothetical protein
MRLVDRILRMCTIARDLGASGRFPAFSVNPTYSVHTKIKTVIAFRIPYVVRIHHSTTLFPSLFSLPTPPKRQTLGRAFAVRRCWDTEMGFDGWCRTVESLCVSRHFLSRAHMHSFEAHRANLEAVFWRKIRRTRRWRRQIDDKR